MIKTEIKDDVCIASMSGDRDLLCAEISVIIKGFIFEAVKRNEPAVLMAFGEMLKECEQETHSAVKVLLPADVVAELEKYINDNYVANCDSKERS